MIKQIRRTSSFKKDFKRISKQNKDVSKLYSVIEKLFQKQILEDKLKDHQLHGYYRTYRELHLEPDWLLIYKLENDELILFRTGSHSELFD